MTSKRAPKARNIPPGNFDPALQRRATSFLQRAVPDELKPHYTPGSLTDLVLRTCAANEGVNAELLEIAAMAQVEYDAAIAAAQTNDLKTYYREGQSLLREIIRAAQA